MHVKFEKTEEGLRLMAVYVAGLVKEGVTFKITEMAGCYGVELTGGF